MAAGHAQNSIERFRLFGVMHGHFDWEDAQPASAMDASNRKLGINMGIAMVIPAEKITEALQIFEKMEETEIAEARSKRTLTITVGDTAPRSNVTFQTSSIIFEGSSLPAPNDSLADGSTKSKK